MKERMEPIFRRLMNPFPTFKRMLKGVVNIVANSLNESFLYFFKPTMSESTLALQPIQPAESVIPPLVTVNPHIPSRTLQEFWTDQNTYTFNNSSNTSIRFKINSAQDFPRFDRSYIKMKLTVSSLRRISDNSGNPDVADVTRYLAEGGVHSMFNSIEISTLSQTRLAQVQNYNSFYAHYCQLNYSKQYIDDCLWRCGDSVGHEVTIQVKDYDVDVTNLEYKETDAGVGTLSGFNRILPPHLNIGDYITIHRGTTLISAVVTAVEYAANAWTVTTASNIKAALAAAGITRLRVHHNVRIEPARWLAANQAQYMVCFQPLHTLLRDPRLFPLPFIRGGLEIRLNLEAPNRCVKTLHTLHNGAAKMAAVRNISFTIEDPCYMVDMVRLDESLMQHYEDMYLNGSINIHFLDVWNFNMTNQPGESANQSYLITAQKRSARYVLLKINGAHHEDSNYEAFYHNDGIATACLAGLESIQLAIGSDRFPSSKPLTFRNSNTTVTPNTFESNAEYQVLSERARASLGVDVGGRRLSHQSQFSLGDNEYTGQFVECNFYPYDPNRIPLLFDISRDPSPFAGCNLTYVNINVHMNYTEPNYVRYRRDPSLLTANDSNAIEVVRRNYYHWVVADAILSISPEGVIVRS